MQLRVLRRARRDIDGAADWYENARAGLGTDSRREVDRALARIATQPGTAPVWLHDPNYRCVHLKRFPYSVFVRRRDDTWVVVAVAHQKRRPASWTRGD